LDIVTAQKAGELSLQRN